MSGLQLNETFHRNEQRDQFTMKTKLIAISALSAFFVPAISHAGSYEDYFGGQEGVNQHLQGSINDMQEFDHHLQGSINDDRKRISAVESEAASNTAWNDRQEGALRGMQGDIKANAEWNDRQEGVIRQNRGRLDENDARNQRQDASIDNAHARIGGVIEQADNDRAVINGNTDRSIGNQQAIGFLQETDAQLAGAIQQGQQAHAVTDKRSINNAERLEGAEGAIRKTNGQLAITDDRTIQNARTIAAGQARTETVNQESIQRDQQLSDGLYKRVQYDGQQDTAIAGNREYAQSVNAASVQRDAVANNERRRIEGESIDRDNALAAESGRIESESIQRDTVIAQQVDYNEQVNAAYRRQSAAQFEQHGAAIESNTQAIANERNERQQMGKDLNAGISGALAAAAATFDPSYYGAQLSVSGGSYRGESAVGLSVGARATESLFINGGVVHDSRGHQGVNAAFNWKL